MGITSRLVALTVAGSLALAGCGGSSGSSASSTSGATASSAGSATSAGASSAAAGSSSAASAKASSSAPTSAAASDQVLGGGSGKYSGQTLTLWDYETADSALGKARALAIKDFIAAHPGVKVHYELKSFEQINSSASLILNSSSAPDVMEYNKGNATSGLLSKQGLLTDLTPEVTKRGWDKLLSPSLQVTAKYDPTGSMGSGKWYGVPTYGEFVLVYYNKDLFAKYGITATPTTLADLESDLAKIKAAGATPIANGGAEYPTQQIFYELSLSKANQQFVNDFQLYQHKVNFQGPEFTFGATTLQDWVNKGYIAKNTVNLKAQDMGNAFEAQKNPIMISGTWWYGTLASEIKNFRWGTFLFPGNTFDAGSSGNLWVVPSKGKNKDLAYDFINITLGKDVQTLMGNSGGIPVNADLSQITDPGNKALIADFSTLNSKSGLAYYPDWPAPGYYDVMRASIQDLMNGKSASGVLGELAKPYNDNLANIGKG